MIASRGDSLADVTQPAVNVAALAASLRAAPHAAAELIAAMRLDTETRLAALETAEPPSGGDGLFFAPVVQFAAMASNAPEIQRVICHCPVERIFSGAFAVFYGGVVCNNSNYLSVEIVALAPDGSSGSTLARGTSQLAGAFAFPNTDGEVGLYAIVSLTLVDGPITIPAGSAAMVVFAMVGTGVAVSIGGAVGVIPSA